MKALRKIITTVVLIVLNFQFSLLSMNTNYWTQEELEIIKSSLIAKRTSSIPMIKAQSLYSESVSQHCPTSSSKDTLKNINLAKAEIALKQFQIIEEFVKTFTTEEKISAYATTEALEEIKNRSLAKLQAVKPHIDNLTKFSGISRETVEAIVESQIPKSCSPQEHNALKDFLLNIFFNK